MKDTPATGFPLKTGDQYDASVLLDLDVWRLSHFSLARRVAAIAGMQSVIHCALQHNLLIALRKGLFIRGLGPGHFAAPPTCRMVFLPATH